MIAAVCNRKLYSLVLSCTRCRKTRVGKIRFFEALRIRYDSIFSLSKNPIIKLRNSRPRLQKSEKIFQKLASKGVSTPSLQAFSDSWQQI